MKTEIIEVSATERELRIEIEPEAVKEVYQKVCQKYARGAQVPGFRKGFAPLDVIKLRFKSEIQDDTLQELLQRYVPQAIQESGLNPLGDPHLHLEDAENVKLNGSMPFELQVHFEVMPEVAVPEYKGLEVVRRVRPITDDEIEEIIEEKRQQFASLIPIEDRASEKGDMLLVDLEGTFEDAPDEPPIVAEDLEIELGSPQIEESFTENLIGLREDDEKEFSVSYAEDFSSPMLAGKTVNYKAKIKSVGKLELPELDDEFADSLDEGYESMKDLREKLKADLELIARAESDARLNNDLVQKLIENHEFEVPNALIESQARNLLNNFARDMSERGFDLNKIEDDFVQMAYGQFREQAVRDVRGAMLLQKIADAENIQVSSEEVAEEIENMAKYYGRPADEIRQSFESQGGLANIEYSLRTRKAIVAIAANAKITDGEWIDPNQQILDEIEAEKSQASEKSENGEAETKPKKKAAKKEK